MTGVLWETRDADITVLATKSDFTAAQGALKSDLVAVKNDLRIEIAETKYEILKWVLSAIGFQTIVVVGAIVAPAKGLH